MQIKWDLHELIDFGDNLRSLGSAFSPNLQRAARDIAKALLRDMKTFTPIDKTGKLIRGWEGNDFLVKPAKDGYIVEIVNTTEYALAVNDGHRAFNQFGGPYPIKRRVKVKSPHQWQEGDLTMYVFGHFFVERGILKLENTDEIEQIIMKELQKWWDSI